VADFLRAIEEPSEVGADLGFQPGRLGELRLRWLDQPGERRFRRILVLVDFLRTDGSTGRRRVVVSKDLVGRGHPAEAGDGLGIPPRRSTLAWLTPLDYASAPKRIEPTFPEARITHLA
jgi:hypothetical protein